MLLSRILILTVCLASATSAAENNWDDPFPPHRIADNLYYVGSAGLASYLITTPQGDILVNTSYERTVPLIRASIEKLGFHISDVKIILGSHAHDDHVAGNALMKKLTGAKIYVMRGDEKTIESGGAIGEYLYKSRWTPVKVDKVLNDGDTVSLGGVTLTAHLTPGHTRGCTTWTFRTTDRGRNYNVVIVGSPNANPGYQLVNNPDYPEISADFARTFRVLHSLACDIFLGAHGEYYGMEAKYARLKQDPNSNPFVDPQGYQAYVAEREQAYLSTRAKQMSAQTK